APPRCTFEVSERPLASPLARLQAAAGNRVTNLCHQPVMLSDFDRQLLPLLDGVRARPQVEAELVQGVRRGRLEVDPDGQARTDSATIEDIVGKAVVAQLPKLAKSALLSG